MPRKVKIDFTGVEAYVRCEEGEHIVKLKKIEEGTSQAGNDQLNVTFEVIQGTSKGARVMEYFTLTDKALWKLKMYLEAIGSKADGRVALDLDKLIDRTCIVEVLHEEFDGGVRAKISNYKKLNKPDPDDEDEDEDDDEDDKPQKKPAKKDDKKPAKKPPKKPAPEPEPEEDDDDDDDDDWEDE